MVSVCVCTLREERSLFVCPKVSNSVCPSLSSTLAPQLTVLVRAHRPKRFPIPLDYTPVGQSLLNSAAGNTSSGDRSSPISSLGRVSVEPLAGSPGAAASRSPTSIGSEEKETEQDEDGRNQKGKEEGLGPRFDQPTRLHVLQALTRGGDAATTPDSLPQAVREHVTYCSSIYTSTKLVNIQ